MWATAFYTKNAFLWCIGEQLHNVLNNKGSLGKISIGLTNYILSKYGGIKYHDCIWLLITDTLFLLKTTTDIHLESELNNFPLHATLLETMWMVKATQYLHSLENFHLNPYKN